MRRLFFECFLLGASVCARQAAAANIGDVLQVQGDWRIAGQPGKLLSGQGVPAGALIQTQTGRKDDYVVVVLMNGNRLSASCEATPCSAMLRIPDSYISSGVSPGRVLDAVRFVLLNRRPEVASAYGSTSSRGVGFERVESIAKLNAAGAIELPGLAGLEKGTYFLELNGAADLRYISGKTLSWTPGQTVSLSVPGPGSYVVLVKDNLENVRLNVFVAVVSSAAFETAKTSFEQAEKVCAFWEGRGARDSAHYFLRAYLLAAKEGR